MDMEWIWATPRLFQLYIFYSEFLLRGSLKHSIYTWGRHCFLCLNEGSEVKWGGCRVGGCRVGVTPERTALAKLPMREYGVGRVWLCKLHGRSGKLLSAPPP